MKRTFLLLLISLLTAFTVEARQLTFYPSDGQAGYAGHPSGFLYLDHGKGIVAGDTINLDEQTRGGTFYWVGCFGLHGKAWAKIVIRRAPGTTAVHIGNPGWNFGDPYNQALVIDSSEYLVFGEPGDRSKFVVNGTISTSLDPNGNPARGGYFNIQCDEFSDWLEFDGVRCLDGGTGLKFKVDVSATVPLSWRSSGKILHHITVNNSTFKGQYNEAFYIGATDAFWKVTTPQGPANPSSPSDLTYINDTATYKQPIGVDSCDFLVGDSVIESGGDAYQIANTIHVQVLGAVAFRWGTRQNAGSPDAGGIVIGNRVQFSHLKDCILNADTTYGQPLQLYASGGGSNIIENCLLVTPVGRQDPISIAPRAGAAFGSIKGATFTITGCTTINGQNSVRVNGAFDSTLPSVTAISNLLVAPTDFTGGLRPYVYVENPLPPSGNAMYSAEGESRYLTLAAANLDASNYYKPNSPTELAGFRYPGTVTGPFHYFRRVYAGHGRRKTSH